MAFSGFLHGNQKADFAGENPAEYLAPEVSVCDFALENGFSLSVPTHPYNYQEEWYDENRDKAIGNENYKEGFDF